MTGTTNSWGWHHTGLAVSNLDKALDYYRETLGFEVVFEARGLTDLISSVTGVPGLGADLAQCKSPVSDQILELLQFTNIPKTFNHLAPILPGRAHTAHLVEDLEKSLHALQAAGGVLLGQITEFSEGRSIYCADTTGNVVELEEQTQGAT